MRTGNVRTQPQRCQTVANTTGNWYKPSKEQQNVHKEAHMLAGIILGLGLSAVAVIVIHLHKEHGPGKKH